jgi:hypothetical protein
MNKAQTATLELKVSDWAKIIRSLKALGQLSGQIDESLTTLANEIGELVLVQID